jgi:glutamyl-tRNA synthetase
MSSALSSAPRLRFAPSPTGYFHVGGARTALFNWFVARQTGGTFVLRIEDTDTDRNRDEWTQGIQDAIRWVGVDWDEGPFFQSQRTHLYASAVEKLLDDKRAYFCTCTGEDARQRNVEAFGKQGEGRGYDGFCRERGLTEGAVRFRTPDEGVTVVVDLIRGEPEFENVLIEDFVIRRTNGGHMFLLANVVDDINMRISHVVRAEEHLPNTPKAVLLWQALTDQPLPVFAHLPVIVNEQRKKLSKRRDKVAVEDFRTQGILPAAMANYLSLLGWTPPDEVEIKTLAQMTDEFRLADVHKSSAMFDLAKLAAFNGEYIRKMSVDEFLEASRPYLTGPFNPINGPLPMAAGLPEGQVPVTLAGGFPAEAFNEASFRAMAPHVQERAKVLSEVPALVDFLFVRAPMDETAWAKVMEGSKDTALAMLRGFVAGTTADTNSDTPSDTPSDTTSDTKPSVAWNAEALKSLVEQLGESQGLKLGKAQAPIRVAVTGRTVGLPLFESLEALGATETISRIENALVRLES